MNDLSLPLLDARIAFDGRVAPLIGRDSGSSESHRDHRRLLPIPSPRSLSASVAGYHVQVDRSPLPPSWPLSCLRSRVPLVWAAVQTQKFTDLQQCSSTQSRNTPCPLAPLLTSSNRLPCFCSRQEPRMERPPRLPKSQWLSPRSRRNLPSRLRMQSGSPTPIGQCPAQERWFLDSQSGLKDPRRPRSQRLRWIKLRQLLRMWGQIKLTRSPQGPDLVVTGLCRPIDKKRRSKRQGDGSCWH